MTLLNNTFFFFILILIITVTLALASIFLSINTVYSTFNLILVFISVSIFLFILDLELIAIVYTTIYVGAVSIFFIFVLMTINIRFEDSLEYNDEIFVDKNFSFFIFFLFSAVMQSFFYFQFKNFFYFRSLNDYLNFMQLQSFQTNISDVFLKKKMYIDSSFENFLAYLHSNSLFNSYLSSSFYKLDIYSDINQLAFSLYDEMQVFFIIVTFILLFSMVSSIGFSVRSK